MKKKEKPFWEYRFRDTSEFVNGFDELPLWSAPFGMMMLKHIPLKKKMQVLDIGSGTGFPLCEIAERLGPDSVCVGMDPWKNANERASRKINSYGLNNVKIIGEPAEKIPFGKNSVDLIVSNLGINNFTDPAVVMKECKRVLKPGGSLCITTNLFGHWKTVYSEMEYLLYDLKRGKTLAKMAAHEMKRGTSRSVTQMLKSEGFKIRKKVEDSLEMRFLDGTAFLHHHFVQCGWLSTWQEIIPKKDHKLVFSRLEKALNKRAELEGELRLEVPMLYVEAVKS